MMYIVPKEGIVHDVYCTQRRHRSSGYKKRKRKMHMTALEKEKMQMHMTALDKEKMHMMDIRQRRERA